MRREGRKAGLLRQSARRASYRNGDIGMLRRPPREGARRQGDGTGRPTGPLDPRLGLSDHWISRRGTLLPRARGGASCASAPAAAHGVQTCKIMATHMHASGTGVERGAAAHFHNVRLAYPRLPGFTRHIGLFAVIFDSLTFDLLHPL